MSLKFTIDFFQTRAKNYEIIVHLSKMRKDIKLQLSKDGSR